MANNFLPTSLSLTATFQQLSTLLEAAGISDASEAPVVGSAGYIKNNDTSINVYIGQGTSAPSSWATLAPESAILFDAGLNANEVWLKCASSTTTADFVEGASEYAPPTVNGVIGTITATEDTVPKADADGNLVASTISDDGSTVTVGADMTVTGTIISDDATTPGLTIESGNTNTGFIDMKGKTSGKLRITAADATAQTVTLTTAAQTSGAGTITIPDLAGASTAPVLTGLAQSITGVKTMTNPVLTAPVVNGATTAAAANNFDFSTGTGTFLTSTGANTLSGAVTVNDATTPSITLASGKTNTGFLLINGKTSGSTKIITADATAQAVVISTAAQTTGGCTLTIPDQAGTSTSFFFANQLLRSYLASTVTYNNNDTLADTALSVTVAASGIYEIELNVFSTAANVGSNGLNMDFAGTATIANFIGDWHAVDPGDLADQAGLRVTAAGTDTETGATKNSANASWTFRGSAEITDAGTFLLRGAQSTSHASNTTILRGSTLTLTRMS